MDKRKIKTLSKRVDFGKTNVIEIIELIRAISSKNDKTSIVRTALNTNSNFRSVVKATYNKFYIYGIKKLDKIPPYRNTNLGTGDNALGLFCTKFLMGTLAVGKSDDRMKMNLSKALDRLSTEEVKVVPLILNRNLDCGISKSTINKAVPGFLPEFPVQLCEKANDKTLLNIKYPAIAQVKEDGLRACAFIEKGVVKIRTRNAKEMQLHGVLDADMIKLSLGNNVVIDGELLAVDENGKIECRRVGNGLGNKAIKGTIKLEDAKKFIFIAWDMIPLEQWKKAEFNYPYIERLKELNKRIKGLSKVRLVETVDVNNLDDAKLYYLSKLKLGLEGIILKNRDSIWNGKRSKDCLKFKVELEGDFRVTNVVEGIGKFKGFLGAFSIESEDGIVVSSVGTGLSAEQRDEYYTEKMIGKIITVKYNELIDNKLDKDHKSLFLPVFVEVREDKNSADTINSL